MNRLNIFSVAVLLLTQEAVFGGQPVCTPGALRTDSTPNCISIEWDVGGPHQIAEDAGTFSRVVLKHQEFHAASQSTRGGLPAQASASSARMGPRSIGRGFQYGFCTA